MATRNQSKERSIWRPRRWSRWGPLHPDQRALPEPRGAEPPPPWQEPQASPSPGQKPSVWPQAGGGGFDPRQRGERGMTKAKRLANGPLAPGAHPPRPAPRNTPRNTGASAATSGQRALHPPLRQTSDHRSGVAQHQTAGPDRHAPSPLKRRRWAAAQPVNALRSVQTAKQAWGPGHGPVTRPTPLTASAAHAPTFAPAAKVGHRPRGPLASPVSPGLPGRLKRLFRAAAQRTKRWVRTAAPGRPVETPQAPRPDHIRTTARHILGPTGHMW